MPFPPRLLPPASPNFPGKRLSLPGRDPWTEPRHSSCSRPPGNHTPEPLSTPLFAPAPQHYRFNFQGGTMLQDLHEQLEGETINDILSRCLQLSLGRGDSSSLNLSFLKRFPWKSEAKPKALLKSDVYSFLVLKGLSCAYISCNFSFVFLPMRK